MTNSELSPVPAVPELPLDAEDHNIATYERVYLKCLKSAANIMEKSHVASEPTSPQARQSQVTIATAMFSRFYEDQGIMKQAKMQAQAMFQGLTKMLEARS